jgi:hypothetical protein
MKKFFVPIIALVLIAGACLPSLTPISDSPTVDSQATLESIIQTGAAETLAVQPTATAVPVIETLPPTIEPVLPANTDTPVPISPAENLTTTPATATLGPEIPTFTSTTVPGLPTLTPTLGILTYGTLPPAAVPFSQITLVNQSKVQAYISLQLSVIDGKVAILEYPVSGRVKVNAPIGEYVYVAWVGGRKMTGTFTLHRNQDLTITLYKDKVVVEKED